MKLFIVFVPIKGKHCAFQSRNIEFDDGVPFLTLLSHIKFVVCSMYHILPFKHMIHSEFQNTFSSRDSGWGIIIYNGGWVKVQWDDRAELLSFALQEEGVSRHPSLPPLCSLPIPASVISALYCCWSSAF